MMAVKPMQRYFTKQENNTSDGVCIVGQDLHHIRHVMRMKKGSEIVVVDESGTVHLASLRDYAVDAVFFDFIRTLPAEEPGYDVTIAQALIKKDRFELMLEKATELGVKAIIPTVFLRSIVKIDANDAERKRLRFQLIVKEAAEQSRRSTVPQIEPVTALADLSFSDYDHVFVCYEGARADEGLPARLATVRKSDRLLFLIGPEGGITAEEIADLSARGAVVCGLGSRILRSETASMYLLSVLGHLWEADR